MFIQTEPTPNPNSLKFLPGRTVLAEGTADFRSPEGAIISPLAQSLFAVDGVTGVYLGADFITITKTDAKEWLTLKPPVLSAIMNHFMSGKAVVDGATDAAHSEDDSEIASQIRELLDTRIRPAVAQDGGDITFERFEDGVVYLHMKGSCAGCPSSTATLKSGIENMLRHYIPEVQEVRAAS